MLVSHMRDANKKPFGTIVALGPDQIGVSVCSTHCKWNKWEGTVRAAGRAACNKPVLLPQYRMIEVDLSGFKWPMKEIIKYEVEKMEERAAKYFKQEEETVCSD